MPARDADLSGGRDPEAAGVDPVKREAFKRKMASIMRRMQDDDARDAVDGLQPEESRPQPAESSDSMLTSSLASSSGRPPSDLFGKYQTGLLGDSSQDDQSEGTHYEEHPRQLDSTVRLSSDEPSVGASSGPLKSSFREIDEDAATVDHGSKEQESKAAIYRPSLRQPMAVLEVYDDGLADAEKVRIRKSRFEVGRLKGDFTLGHELQMSRLHFQIECANEADEWRWWISDLDSLNGTFVKVNEVTIGDQTEVLIGGELVRFLLPSITGSLTILKIAPGEKEQRQNVLPGDWRIGTQSGGRNVPMPVDPEARPGIWRVGQQRGRVLPLMQDSPYLDPSAFLLEYDSRKGWRISDLNSTNGLWVGLPRRTPHPLEDGAEFQAGEQRFRFRLP